MPQPDSQGRKREDAGHEKQNGAEDVGPPDVPVGLRDGEVVRRRRQRADVEEKRPRELRDRRQPVPVARPPGPRQRPDTGVLALLVYFRHPRTLSLYQLEVRRLGKEDGSHKEGNGVRGSPDRVYISGDRPQGKTRSADHEQPGDSRVETYRLYKHAPAFGLRLSARRPAGGLSAREGLWPALVSNASASPRFQPVVSDRHGKLSIGLPQAAVCCVR